MSFNVTDWNLDSQLTFFAEQWWRVFVDRIYRIKMVKLKNIYIFSKRHGMYLKLLGSFHWTTCLCHGSLIAQKEVHQQLMRERSIENISHEDQVRFILGRRNI
ncbi:unnamed protein product [Umbelopsis ramanniana]